jgi:hypothetical protein
MRLLQCWLSDFIGMGESIHFLASLGFAGYSISTSVLGVERASIGRLNAIFVADSAGAPMRSCDQVLAVVDAGLAEDRYAMGRGFWRLTDGCQVTLIHAEDLARAERRHGLSLGAGQHRRNFVVTGLVGPNCAAGRFASEKRCSSGIESARRAAISTASPGRERQRRWGAIPVIVCAYAKPDWSRSVTA